jgi:hypothetical protein
VSREMIFNYIGERVLGLPKSYWISRSWDEKKEY